MSSLLCWRQLGGVLSCSGHVCRREAGWVRLVHDRAELEQGGDARGRGKASSSNSSGGPPDVATLSAVEGDEGTGGKAVYFKKVR
jgi:hypothetical protein